ncbi:DUF6049 family protein [Frankia sp. AgB32]|uniref:DUF6049 family protein n=1 Tax=Frankia sp. AgB32 TaxID=631119 RepID=UPI00200DB863|nr:DUF6049 family protein [Frankia sp. AgB32]MCK9893286.1 DUF6049 family protein [Frankia sp. AgB32]
MMLLVAALVPLAGAPAASAAAGTRGGLAVEPAARTDSSTGTPRSSTGSSTDEPGESVASSPVVAGSTTGAANPVAITVTDVVSPTAGSATVSVRGTMAATTADPLTDLWMSLSIGTRPVTSRDRLAALAANPTTSGYQRLPLTGGADVQPIADPPVRGGSPVPFEITANLDAAGGAAARFGAYPLQVRVSGSVAGRAAKPIGAAYSFAVRSSAQAQRTKVTVVLPIADQPRLRSDGLLTDNVLADEVKPTGRMSKLLDAASPPVVLAVDPTLVQALRRMSDREGYNYASPAGGVHMPRSLDAYSFLSRLVDYAAQGGTVIALPYGDADLAALVHAQKLDTVEYAVRTGQVVLGSLLSRAPRPVAFPADGLADATTVDVLGQLKVGAVLLDDRLLPAPGSTYTPSAGVDIATSSGAPIRALATDHRLADVATSYTGAADGPSAGAVLARFRADLATITAERPETRHLVLALPRNWQMPDDWAQQVLGAINSDYSETASIDDLLGTGQLNAPRGGLVYPADARARELPASYLDSVANVRDEAQALYPVLCAPPQNTVACRLKRINPMSDALVTATSVWWRGDRMVDGVSLSQQVDGDVSSIRNGIQVVASRSVNLTSRHGLVPITLENNTPWDVSVVLAFSSTNRSRLRSALRETRALQPRQKAQIEIEVDSEGAGTFPLEIRLLNLDGQALSSDPPTRILVRSTVYGAIATGITVLAVSVLLLAVLFRLVRRLRPGARRPAPAVATTADESPADPAATVAGAPGELDRPSPDLPYSNHLGAGPDRGRNPAYGPSHGYHDGPSHDAPPGREGRDQPDREGARARATHRDAPTYSDEPPYGDGPSYGDQAPHGGVRGDAPDDSWDSSYPESAPPAADWPAPGGEFPSRPGDGAVNAPAPAWDGTAGAAGRHRGSGL